MIAGNWKMNHGAADAADFFKKLKGEVSTTPKNVEVLVCAPFTSLAASVDAAKGIKTIHVGAQNMHFEASGAYTGEVSAEMLKETGCSHVLVGHSERRQYFAETDETVNLKTKKALTEGIVPVVCVGELLEERKADKHFDVVTTQVEAAFKDVSAKDAATIVIAYEPVWAIGTGEVATPEQAQEMHAHIRSVLGKLYDTGVADTIRILYGGSMKPSNAPELLGQKDVDGGLIGGASLKADSFNELIQAAEKASS